MLERLRRRHRGSSLPNLVLYEVVLFSARVALAMLFRHRRRNGDRMPVEGAVLIIANHQSFLDPAMISTSAPRQIEFIARRGLFKVPLFGRFISALHAFPIDESGGDTAAMKETLRRLRDGRAVLIFPEGTRTTDGATAEFKRGIAVLLKRAKCPVIPVAVEGAFDAWPRTSKLPKPFVSCVETAYGDPIPHEELLADGPEAALTRLHSEVESLRQSLHASIRQRTNGAQPSINLADR